jgi:hypothetical protein
VLQSEGWRSARQTRLVRPRTEGIAAQQVSEASAGVTGAGPAGSTRPPRKAVPSPQVQRHQLVPLVSIAKRPCLGGSRRTWRFVLVEMSYRQTASRSISSMTGLRIDVWTRWDLGARDETRRSDFPSFQHVMK